MTRYLYGEPTRSTCNAEYTQKLTDDSNGGRIHSQILEILGGLGNNEKSGEKYSGGTSARPAPIRKYTR